MTFYFVCAALFLIALALAFCIFKNTIDAKTLKKEVAQKENILRDLKSQLSQLEDEKRELLPYKRNHAHLIKNCKKCRGSGVIPNPSYNADDVDEWGYPFYSSTLSCPECSPYIPKPNDY